jgi:hypothetical protein
MQGTSTKKKHKSREIVNPLKKKREVRNIFAGVKIFLDSVRNPTYRGRGIFSPGGTMFDPAQSFGPPDTEQPALPFGGAPGGQPSNPYMGPPEIPLFDLANLPRQRVEAPPPKPSKKLQDRAEEWVPKALKSSHEYVKTKRTDWLRLERLFKNELPLNFWNSPGEVLEKYLRNITQNAETTPDPANWNSQLCLSIASLVLAFADAAFRSLYSSDQWLRVHPDETIEHSMEDQQFSTSDKLQNHLIHQLKSSRIKPRVYEALMFTALFNTCFGKVVWEEKQVAKHYTEQIMDPTTGAPLREIPITEYETVWSRPKLQIIKPDQILPDPYASDDDLQTWNWIAHIAEVSRGQVLERFASGAYNINEKEFRDRFNEIGSQTRYSEIGDIQVDQDRTAIISESLDTFKVWEYHGLIPTDDGDTECVCTIITEISSDEPETGVMVRLQEGTALRIGLRPFVCAQYTQWPGAFGIGAVQPQLDLVWATSHLTNLLIDNLRLTCNAMYAVQRGGSAARELEIDPTFRPGRVICVDRPTDLTPLTPGQFDAGNLQQLIQYLDYTLQMRTGVSESARGVAGKDKTATEAQFLQNQLHMPIANRLEIFVENFLDPALTMALASIQQNTLEGVQIAIKDASGVEQFVPVTAEEIRTGRYRVEATLGRPDEMRLATAQTVERVLPVVAQLQMQLQGEGYTVGLGPLVRTLLEKLQVERIDEIVRRMTPEEQQQFQQQQMMMQQQQMMMEAQGNPSGGPGNPPPGGAPPGGQGGPPTPSPDGPPAPRSLPDMDKGFIGPDGGPMTDADQIRMMLQQEAADAEGRSWQQG